MKETFIIRTEWYDAIAELKEKEQALMMRNLFEYHLGRQENVSLPSFAMKIVWKLIEPSLKRNVDKYDRRCETSAENGKRGGRPKKEEETEVEKPKEPNKPTLVLDKKPNKPIEKPIEPNNPDSDSVRDSDRERVTSKEVGVSGAVAPPPKPKTFKQWSEPEFYNDVAKHQPKFSKEILRAFYDYWREKSTSGKMRFQLEQTWETALRLATWQRIDDEKKNRSPGIVKTLEPTVFNPALKNKIQ